MSFGTTRRSGYDPVGLVRPDSRNAVIDGNGNGFSSPLPPTSTTFTYPPTQLQDRGASMSQSSIPPASGSGRRVHMNDSIDLNKPRLDSYDAERNQYGPRMPEPSRPGLSSSSRNSSWDLLNGIRKIETGYEEFDSRNASSRHLVFADGDVPQNKLSKFYHYLLNVSIVSRWILFIIPILAILWIPGILQLTDTTPNGNVWSIPFMWWSIWLSVVWGGWWASLAGSLLIPPIIRATLGAVAVGARRYIDWAGVLHRYVAFFGWSLAVWVSFNPLIDKRQSSDASDSSVKAINILGRLLFGVYLCSAVLLGEKFAIQFIAGKFHERSYAERIADQKFAVRSLVTLYRNSSDIPGRSDTLKASHAKAGSVNPKRFFKRALKGVRSVATTTTTAFGNVASEIAGSSVLQPNSPQAMVKTALESANKSRLLARRLFYSFVRPGSEYIFVEDIARFFPSAEEADQVFALFDHDTNGDASRDEVEMACMEFHREQLSIEHSMQDLDSAVGRLDNIFMSVYFIAALLIIAICLEAGLSTVVTGAGTFVLGLSWLIGSTLADVLTSIIFLFIRHPFDVGDRVDVDKVQYTVKEIRLLSTIFINTEGVFVQVPNSVLNGHFIHNIRRSGQMSEEFKFDVAYETSFDDLERLRHRMLDFVQTERRDYQPSFDVQVLDFPEQEKITLTAEIKYKSNGQMDGLKAKRRNKWVCALKTAMAEVPIYGPKGGPDAPAGPTRYTKVPWDEVKAEERVQQHERVTLARPVPVGGWNLADSNAAIIGGGDVFGEADELNMTSPRRTPSEHHPSAAGTFQMPDASTMPTPAQAPPIPTHSQANEYEMTPRQ